MRAAAYGSEVRPLAAPRAETGARRSVATVISVGALLMGALCVGGWLRPRPSAWVVRESAKTPVLSELSVETFRDALHRLEIAASTPVVAVAPHRVTLSNIKKRANHTTNTTQPLPDAGESPPPSAWPSLRCVQQRHHRVLRARGDAIGMHSACTTRVARSVRL